MQMVGEDDIDIRLTDDGQPAAAEDGECDLVEDDECWLQDLKNEAMCESGELFYEDQSGDSAYGWGLSDFIQAEHDGFTEMEIRQRIQSKIAKRSYIDSGSIKIEMELNAHHIRILIRFKRTDEEKEYTLGIESDGVEVIVE